jgi:hypothetical protein
MQSKEQSYFVTVKKSYEVTYQVYAYSFEQALMLWDQEGNEQDIQPLDSIVLGLMVSEES